MKAKIEWKSVQSILGKRKLDVRGRRFLASEVLRRSNKRVPIRDGYLRDTAVAAADGKSVLWVQPYAETQYYNTPTTRSYDSIRGGKWFERTKSAERLDIVRAVAGYVGGRVE